MNKRPFLKGFLYIFFIGFVCLAAVWILGNFGVMNSVVGSAGEKIGVVVIEGVITKSRPVIRQIHKYRDAGSIKAIIVRINSPGGSVSPSQEIYEELMKLREDKKIVVSMGAVAASGGYYIASAAHEIYANPGTITGSIGVIVESANMQELLDKIGLKSVVIKSGKYKDILSPTRQIQEEERALLQEVIDTIHKQFITAVVEGRGLQPDAVREIADGRIMTGEQARDRGLVDELGNLHDAVDAAARMAGIDGTPDIVYPEKKRPSIWDFILQEAVSTLKDMAAREEFSVSYRSAPLKGK
jgi:protease-4